MDIGGAAKPRRIYKTTPAQRARNEAWQAVNKPRMEAARQARLKATRDWLLAFLRSHPCVDCGESDFVVLDLDHRGGKKLAVSKMMGRAYALPTIIAEVEKCDVRCANCHRRRSAHQLGTWRGKVTA